MTLIERLRSERIVAILRGRSAERLDAVIDALVDSGVRTLEVTVPTPGALEAIRAAVDRHGDEVLIGAGTVLTVQEADLAAAAGARFLVTPNTDHAVIAHAFRLGLEVLPGALTPSEIVAAHRAGAVAVKVFPARTVGPAFFRDVAVPLPGTPLVAVGGVALPDIAAYLEAGALAVGLGGPLIGDALDGGPLAGLTERAAAARANAVTAIGTGV